MPDQTTKSSASSAANADQASALFPLISIMFRAFWASPERNRIILLAAGVVFVISLTAFGQVRLNAWNQPFYDALARKNFPQFIDQLMVFAFIAGGLLILNVSQSWLN